MWKCKKCLKLSTYWGTCNHCGATIYYTYGQAEAHKMVIPEWQGGLYDPKKRCYDMKPLTLDHYNDAFKYMIQGIMRTKKQKQIDWLKEQGYVKDGAVLIVYPTDKYSMRANSHYVLDAHFNYEYSYPIGIFKDGEFIKMPEFQDDAVDESLQGYLLGCTDRAYSLSAVLTEINKRLKNLEAAVLNQTKLEK